MRILIALDMTDKEDYLFMIEDILYSKQIPYYISPWFSDSLEEIECMLEDK